jgi:signal transduction histidine kinase
VNTIRTILVAAAVAMVGVVGTFAVAAATGMPGRDIGKLLGELTVGTMLTIVAALAAGRLLRPASLRSRMVAVAVVAAAVGLANLFVLTRLMFVSDHDAAMVTVILLYSLAAGVGAAVALAHSSAAAVTRLAATAARIRDGDLEARVGEVEGGAELASLARTLDEMTAKLVQARRREQRVEAMRRDLMTAVSHDLRTPIASLRAMIEAVDEGVVDDPDDLRRYSAQMRRSVQQLSEMIDDLFELAQLEAGAIETQIRRASVEDAVERAVETVRAEAEEKGVAILTDVQGLEDASCSSGVVRVLHNLLVNAVRHTPADGSVLVEASSDRGGVELAVEDTGEGIPPRDLERVFEPFFRSDPARAGPGAGLGLTLSKRIVEALGGTIRAESTPAVGSRFSIRLPATAMHALPTRSIRDDAGGRGPDEEITV